MTTHTMDIEKYIEQLKSIVEIYEADLIDAGADIDNIDYDTLSIAREKMWKRFGKIVTTLTRIAEEAREDERNHWLAGERCTTCGGEKEADPCTDTCLTCLEDE